MNKDDKNQDVFNFPNKEQISEAFQKNKEDIKLKTLLKINGSNTNKSSNKSNETQKCNEICRSSNKGENTKQQQNKLNKNFEKEKNFSSKQLVSNNKKDKRHIETKYSSEFKSFDSTTNNLKEKNFCETKLKNRSCKAISQAEISTSLKTNETGSEEYFKSEHLKSNNNHGDIICSNSIHQSDKIPSANYINIDSKELPPTHTSLYENLEHGINPNARFFIMKSSDEDNIYKSIKYRVWCSSYTGNKILNEAFKRAKNEYPIYLIFSVNRSGRFVGICQMISEVNFNSTFVNWSDSEKYRGYFFLVWVSVKDVPSALFANIFNKYVSLYYLKI